ncbi:MAG: hypothetical protein ABEI74_02150 [Candidatus Pacearchaeota archaeon]
MIKRTKQFIEVKERINGNLYTIRLDPRNAKKDCINITTHGHSDHIPNYIESDTLICTEITKRMIEFYRGICEFTSQEGFENDDLSINLYDAGHCLGAKMAFIVNKESGHRILYTGDYNPRSRYCGRANPIKCDTLIIDSTYGDDKYSFPDYETSVKDFINYLKENFDQKIAIITYNLGKPQEIAQILESHGIRFSIDPKLKKINDLLGLEYNYEDTNSNFLITRANKRGMLNISASGWAINSGFVYARDIDRGFVISDHADFNDSINFISQCSPERVYTVFGSNKKFAKLIERELGIKSIPLIVGQHSLDSYF